MEKFFQFQEHRIHTSIGDLSKYFGLKNYVERKFSPTKSATVSSVLCLGLPKDFINCFSRVGDKRIEGEKF